ncbi:MAG: hypothetical protein ACBZ72_02220 [Candidatus Bathyarchaeia archaeon]|jgi:hypothetical protein
MQLTYNTTDASLEKTLYQLVLIVEVGYGRVDLLIKTQFGEATLMPSNATKLINKVAPQNQTTLTYTTNGTALTSATLQYTLDQWINGQLQRKSPCNSATKPAQPQSPSNQREAKSNTAYAPRTHCSTI